MKIIWLCILQINHASYCTNTLEQLGLRNSIRIYSNRKGALRLCWPWAPASPCIVFWSLRFPSTIHIHSHYFQLRSYGKKVFAFCGNNFCAMPISSWEKTIFSLIVICNLVFIAKNVVGWRLCSNDEKNYFWWGNDKGPSILKNKLGSRTTYAYFSFSFIIHGAVLLEPVRLLQLLFGISNLFITKNDQNEPDHLLFF